MATVVRKPGVEFALTMSPCVVLAWKFGASDPSLRRGCSAAVAKERREMGATVRRAIGAVWRATNGVRGAAVAVAARKALRTKGAAMID